MSPAWILVVVLSVIVIYLLATRNRGAKDPGRVESARDVAAPPPPPAEPVERPRGDDPAPGPGEAAATGVTTPGGAEEAGDPRPKDSTEATRELLAYLLDYLERSPLAFLRDADERFDLPDPAIDALHALEDLAFYGTTPDATVRKESLSHLVQGVTREYTDEHGIRIRVTGPERPVIFRVASEWLKDIVYLALANAHHFGDADGIEVRLNGGPGVAALIEIRDFGEGFSEEALENAFDPFWTTDPGATGLGLFHARLLIGRMGGRIDLDNHPDGGGRLRILLPAQPPSEAAVDHGDGEDGEDRDEVAGRDGVAVDAVSEETDGPDSAGVDAGTGGMHGDDLHRDPPAAV